MLASRSLPCRVRVVSGGTIATVAGNGTCSYGGDGGAATSARLNQPYGVAVDTSGNLYIADYTNCRVRKVIAGTISTVAGNGTCAYSGDVGAATSASLHGPSGVAVDSGGNLYIADEVNCRVRRVSGGRSRPSPAMDLARTAETAATPRARA